jgi:hypothetical protein
METPSFSALFPFTWITGSCLHMEFYGPFFDSLVTTTTHIVMDFFNGVAFIHIHRTQKRGNVFPNDQRVAIITRAQPHGIMGWERRGMARKRTDIGHSMCIILCSCAHEATGNKLPSSSKASSLFPLYILYVSDCVDFLQNYIV